MARFPISAMQLDWRHEDQQSKSLLEIRSAQKAASRAADAARMRAGVSPVQIQEENAGFKGRFTWRTPLRLTCSRKLLSSPFQPHQ